MSEQFTTLNTEAIAVLKRPFAAQYHDFVRGFVYLAERAVCERIEQVDPAWSLEIINVTHHPERKRVNVVARMTILGVKREDIGSGTYLDTPVKDYKTKQPKTDDLGEVMMNYSEAEKGAATDALRRCARRFGIGRYLLDAPKDMKTESALAKWLTSIGGDSPPSHPQPSQSPQPSPKQASKVDQGIPEGTTKTVTIEKRTTKKDKPKLWFRTSERDGSLLVKAYSRQPFIEKLYCTETDWLKEDEVEAMQFSANIVMGKYGYWEFDFKTLPDFDPQFEAATREQQVMQGTPEPQWEGDVPM